MEFVNYKSVMFYSPGPMSKLKCGQNESGNGNDLSRFISISPSSLAANVNRAGQGDGRCKVCPGNKKMNKNCKQK
jgi:hypothetical protein